MVYVDSLFSWPAAAIKNPTIRFLTLRHKQWCHLFADSEDELVDFARQLGLNRTRLQMAGTYRAHFDLTPPKRALALQLGAKSLSRREGALLLKRKVLDQSQSDQASVGHS